MRADLIGVDRTQAVADIAAAVVRRIGVKNLAPPARCRNTDAKAVAIRGNKSGPNVLQKVDATVGGYVYVLISGSK